MQKKVGRNDPCPCGSGKKYKKCCEERLEKKKFTAQVLTPSQSDRKPAEKAKDLSTHFFKHLVAPKAVQPEHAPPHDHPEPNLPI